MLATLVACKRWPLKATTFLVRNLLNEQRSVLITSGRVILLSSHGLLQPPTDTSGVELHSGLRRSGSLIREAAAGCYRFFSRGVNAICIVLRALQLAVIFTPFFIISPLAAWSDTFKPVWFRVLVWTLETSGPVFVKLGQWASTRRDLFPLILCQNLSRLQRQSHVHSWFQTKHLLEEAFGDKFSDVFRDFEKSPVGSGCCAQVYRAQLNDVEKSLVAVKVLHPSIEDRFHRDLKVMNFFIQSLKWMFPSLDYLSLEESLVEFSKLMRSQIDLRTELGNLQKFHEAFKDSQDIVFPKPVLHLCSKKVLVETFEGGQHIGDFLDSDEFEKEVEFRREVAEIGMQMLFRMIFVHNFVHGDLHPGNLLVRRDGAGQGQHQIVVLDPGICASLEKRDMRNLRSVFAAVVQGHGRIVGQLFLENSLHTCEDPESFMADMSQIVTEARSRSGLFLSEVNVSDLLSKVFGTLLRHRVKLEANYASVILAILVLEGLGRTLDPSVDILTKAMPYLLKSGH